MARGVYYRSLKHRQYMSELNKGRPSSRKGKTLPIETKRKISQSVKKAMSNPEIKRRMSELAKKRIGELSSHWKGGITPINKKIRNSVDYQLWRKACLERDNFTCQITGQHGGDLVVHHINNFAEFPELRFAIDNGITMTKKMHQQFHKMFGEHNNTLEQIELFRSKIKFDKLT